MIYSGEINYEKKYKEALEKARKTLEKSSAKDVAKLVVEYFFPELAEIEEEKIRQWLVDYFKEVGKSWIHRDISPEEILAYLEKQKEQKPELPLMGGDTDTYFDNLRMTTKPLTSREWFNEGIKYAQRLQKEQHPSSRFLPRDWIVYDGPLGHAILQIEDVIDGRYTFVDNDSTLLVEDSDKFLRPLTPKDVEKPAEWSEEDDKMRRNLMSLLANLRGNGIKEETYQKYYPWLKFLRPSWKPSEEQMSMLLAVINDPNNAGAESCYMALKSIYNNLKKL